MKSNRIFIVVIISSCVFSSEQNNKEVESNSLELNKSHQIDTISGYDLFIENCCMCHDVISKSVYPIPFKKFANKEDSFYLAYNKVKGVNYHEKIKIDSIGIKKIYNYIIKDSIYYNRN